MQAPLAAGYGFMVRKTPDDPCKRKLADFEGLISPASGDG